MSMTAWIWRITAGVLVVFSCIYISAGDLEPILQRCCLSGEAWARNHSTCVGPTQELTSISPQDRLTCLTSLYICCVRTHRKISCERGKEVAKQGRLCGTLQTSDHFVRDCCDGCSLGIQAGVMRMSCGFLQFSFGAPWDEAYIDCCENVNSNQGTSQQQRQRTCDANNPCAQKCEAISENRIVCSCYPGFKLAPDGANCEDLNECLTGTHSCNRATEYCINENGGFQCVSLGGEDPTKPGQCPEGFIFNQRTLKCDDIDECLEQPCPRGKLCVNTQGSYTCTNDQSCSPGFVLHQTTGFCIDVDECSKGLDSCNRSTEICQNSHGSYQCIPKPSRNRDCPAGFKWSTNKDNCEDIEECSENIHACDASKQCRNTMGGYECEEKCPPWMKYEQETDQCIEQDACADGLNDCKQDEICIPEEGGLKYVCIPKSPNNQCPPGFKPGTGTTTCVDINECEEFPDICDPGKETCVNGIGSYDCVATKEPLELCPAGFKADASRSTCVDVDECSENTDRCNRTLHDCVNRNGTYDCVPKQQGLTCPLGYRPNAQSTACEDVNECVEGRHKCLPDKEQCVNVPGGYRCQELTVGPPCPAGHRFNLSTSSCTDVDECSEGSHACNSEFQNCANTPGSYRCISKASCPHGYRWTGTKCEDINECLEDTHDCDRRFERCVNTIGSYQCQSIPNPRERCGAGYVFDSSRQACDDINECQLGLHVCAESQRCDNTVGSYTCVRVTGCGTGYTLNAASNLCEDDDECALGTHNCGQGFACRNIQGSFRCDRVQCPPGQRLLAGGICKLVNCGPGMEIDSNGNCIDINECARADVCRSNQRCINTVGSYRCQNLLNCAPGYELNELGNQCIDVDECSRRLYECGPQQTCRNHPGGYSCVCPRGYNLNLQRECEDIDECTRFRGQICSRYSECINTQGSYVCNCKDGFRKADDDKNCDDVDECAESPNICQQVCNNVWGSYQCSCRPGFTLGADNRSCHDIDECQTYAGHGELCIGYCVNEPGSFSCSCPSGYRLSSDKRTCQDIDECQEQSVCRGEEEICLNTRGGYKCNRVGCPPNYVRDRDHRKEQASSDDTVVCRKRCQSNHIDCILNATQTITYQSIVLPSIPYLPHPLILTTMRAVTSRNTGMTFNTDFQIVEGNTGGLFDILKGEGVGSLRLTRALSGPLEMRIKILMAINMRQSPRSGFTSTSHHLALIDVIVSEYDF